jgi:hypothetical protein
VRRTPATDAVGTVVVRDLDGKMAGQPDDVTVLAIDAALYTQRSADRADVSEVLRLT